MARKHTRNLSESPEEREYGTKMKAKDAVNPDYDASPQRHQSGKHSTRETYHSPENTKKENQREKYSGSKGYGMEEPQYGPDPVKKRKRKSGSGSESDEMDDREKRHQKKSRKHRKYSDESLESEALSDESGRGAAKRRRREEKRRQKREERRQRREKHRRKQKVSGLSESESDIEGREGSEGEADSEKQKRVEMELKERALRSLRAKKGATQ